MANIQKRGNNSFFFTVSLGRDANNKYRRRTKTITVEQKMTPKQLREHLNAEYLRFKEEVLSGAYISPGKMAFQKFVEEEWRPKYAKDELSPTTLKAYNEHLNTRILPAFGHFQIDQITSLQIVSFLDDMKKPGARKDGRGKYLDIGTIQFTYRVLRNVFKRAKKWKAITHNPMDGVSKPQASKQAKAEKAKKNRESKHYYDEQEAQAVVDALYRESLKWRLLILCSMIGGFRRGELVGLEWSQVNFSENTIKVENNIPLTENGQPVEKGPKSTSSERTVDMPKWYMDHLETYQQEWEKEKEAWGNKWEGGKRKYVFHNGVGKPYYYEHPSKWWRKFCLRHNLRYIKLHGLRHSMGTLMLEDADNSNVDFLLKVIQERLGHSRQSTTEDIYLHVTKRAKKQTASTFDKFNRMKEDPVKLKRVK